MDSCEDKTPHDFYAKRRDTLPIILEPDDEVQLAAEPHAHGDLDTMKELQVPTHPIQSMQGAFAESMLEAAESLTSQVPQPDTSDAVTRRRKLLEQDITEETHVSKWKQRPGQRHHELWKLMAQISFGIYLLLNGIAKDDEQVLTILQGHVDEVDSFLEMTLEDFDLALKDIDERLKFLKMPLENITIFDAMLEDREFRLQIITGNERIEHIITRTATAMNDALKDVQQGLDATKEFAIYLAEEQDGKSWKRERPEMQKVYDAMKGNAEGWHKAYVSLQTNGNALGTALVQLGTIVAEMDRRAGEVSRKTRFSISPGTSPTSPTKSFPTSPRRARSDHSRPSITKDLPSDPSMITPAIRAVLPAFQYVSERDQALEAQSDGEKEVVLGDEREGGAQPFTLEPRTYTPIPPPARIETPDVEKSNPEVHRKPSLRNRFSIKKKSTSASSSPTSQIETSSSHQKEINIGMHPLFRGSDSAYCSDIDKTPFHNSTSYEKSPSSTATTPPLQNAFGKAYTSPPQSEQQKLHAAKAGPHSPSQRPWTAAPSNLRAPSAMAMSTMSQSMIMTENNKKVKKKRSAFGWLKNAFSLTDEEKAIFEAKRRAPPPPVDYGMDRKPKFLDGKRIR